MQKAPIADFESERLEAVQELGVLDTVKEERFDKITKKGVELLKVPISSITIIDKDREWFKSCQGSEICEGPRETSFCGHALLSENIFIVEDTLKDKRFADNPNVVGGQKIRFYAGIRLFNRSKRLPVGVFCVRDIKPRKLNTTEIATLLDLAEKAEVELNK